MFAYPFRIVLPVTMGLSMAAASFSWAEPAEGPACAAQAAQIKNVQVDSVHINDARKWLDGSSVVRLDVSGTPAACWISPEGKVRQIVFAQDAGQGPEHVCGGEAALAKDIRMSAVRVDWSFQGPDGHSWVRLNVDGQPADCHVDGKGEVLEVAFERTP